MKWTIFATVAISAATAQASLQRSPRGAHTVVVRGISESEYAAYLAARDDPSLHKNDERTLCLLNGILKKRTFNLFGCPTTSTTSNGWPSSSWQCSGNGLDGYGSDYNGNSCPSKYPSGWKWFGSNYGWGPPKGWAPPTSNWLCPTDFVSITSKCLWWQPPNWWILPIGFNFNLTNWLNLGWINPKPTTTAAPVPTAPANNWPSSGWQCSGSGSDGWSMDNNGNSCPSKYPSGWLWFGSNFGWGPPKGWQPPTASWSCPLDFDVITNKCGWWAPPTWWLCPTGFNFPFNVWINLGWSAPKTTTTTTQAPATTTTTTTTQAPTTTTPSNNWPSSGWQCSGSGSDGWSMDNNGNSCPSKYPSGWLWFGSNFGWGPPKGWQPPTASWSCPLDFDVITNKCGWWAPPTWWICPTGFNFPFSIWINLGWSAPKTTTTAAPTTTTTTTTTQTPTQTSTPTDCQYPQGVALFANYQSTVNGLAAISASSAQDCASKCLATSSCRAFDYWVDSNGGQCGMQVTGGGMDGMQPSAGCTHGAVGHCETLIGSACSASGLDSSCSDVNVCPGSSSAPYRLGRRLRH